MLQKVRFSCTRAKFCRFVVSREVGLKRAMCKKHCKYREKLASLHFDVLSSFYIVPRRRNIGPRRPNKTQHGPNIVPGWPDRPTESQDGATLTSATPNIVPRWANIGPRRPKMVQRKKKKSKRRPEATRGRQHSPKMGQRQPNETQHRPKTTQQNQT